MPELDLLTWLIIAVFVLVITLWILYEIIKAATKSSRIENLLEEQNKLIEKLIVAQHLSTQIEESHPFPSNEITDLNDPDALESLLKALPKKNK